MPTQHNLPYVEIQFTKHGTLLNPDDQNTIFTSLQENHITDLLVMVHGWNNDLAEARNLFASWISLLSPRLPSDRKFAALGILWPSKKFADEELRVGVGASMNVVKEKQVLEEQLILLSSEFEEIDHDKALHQAIGLIPFLESNPNASKQYLEIIKTLLEAVDDKLLPEPGDGTLQKLDSAKGMRLLERISEEVIINQPKGHGGAVAVGLANSISIGSLWGDVVTGARMMANVLTYYTMKNRAGVIGVNGLYPLLRAIRQLDQSLKFHLIGHSFGARLVTAATAHSTLPVHTLSLLQAAFSHYGFAKHYDRSLDGIFRPVLTGRTENAPNLIGPAIVTFSRQDKAVGIAYAVASRIANQVAEAVGDKDDFYGGLGGNGAQLTPEASNNFRLGDIYHFKKGRLFNIDSNKYSDGKPYINSHGDVRKAEIADAIMAAISIT